MTRTFVLKKGTLVFQEDKIVINDNSKSQRNMWLVLCSIGVIIGGLFILYFRLSGNDLLLWIGLFYSIAHLVVFFAILLGPIHMEIESSNIRWLKLKKRYGNNYLEIKLLNNRIRRVNQIENPEFLAQYLDIVLKHKWNIE